MPAPIAPTPLARAWARMESNSMEESLARAKGEETERTHTGDEPRVREATRNAWHWMRNHTRTFNPHWKEEGCASPYEPFPDNDYFQIAHELIRRQKVTAFEKSRDMMMSWAIVGYFIFEAMLTPAREIVFQSMTEDKSKEMIGYAKQLYRSQPDWLQEAFPLVKPIEQFAEGELGFRNGSVMWGIPAGKDQIRSFHPWGYIQDESCFQAEAGASYDNAQASAMKIVLNSTASASWYGDFCQDAVA
jgi:hypothetical protein